MYKRQVFKQVGISEEGKVLGYHTAMGYIPRSLQRLKSYGVMLPEDIFKPTDGRQPGASGPKGRQRKKGKRSSKTSSSKT